MKKLILITTPLLLVACSHYEAPIATTQIPAQPAHANLPAETSRQGQYLALPGQGAIDTDAAFDQQVAAYAGQPVQPAVPQGMAPQQGVAAAPVQAVEGAMGAVAPAAPIPAPDATGMMPAVAQPSVSAMGAQAMDSMGNAVAGVTGAAMGAMQTALPTPVGGLVDYTLRITNATSGRVFIEAQDAAGEIYPCGFMTGSQSISTEKKQVAPIKGPITVVVRDPDKPDAPELRRYKVTPPADYAGKMLEITIISGGLYQVSVNGQVRYITPTPVGKPDLGTTPANPQPAPAPATDAAAAPAPAADAAASAPIPEPVPAGM